MRFLLLISVAFCGVLQFTQPRTERRDVPQRLPGFAFDEVADDSESSLEVRLAETKLQLAQVELRRAIETNRRVPGTFPPGTLERLEQAVMVGNKQLALSKGKEHDLHAVHLLQLEAQVEFANRQQQAAMAANRRSPGVVDDTSLERLRLQAEVARLTLARARKPSSFESTQAHVQWQVDRLYDELQRLRNDVDVLSLRK